jgi:hypothetical protein
MESAIRGRLQVATNECVYLAGRNGSVADVVWPKGYSAVRQSDEQIAILDAAGSTVAITGRVLEASGGGWPHPIDLVCSAPRAGAVLVITDELPAID